MSPPIESFNILQQAVQHTIDAGVLRRGAAETYSHVLWVLVHGITSLAVAKMPHFTTPSLEPTANTALQIALEGLRRG